MAAPDAGIGSILLVRLRLVGDVVFTTPVIGALRRRYPAARLSYVVEASAAPIVAGHPDLTEVIIAPRRRGLARVSDDWALARRLRRARFDVAIDLHGGPRSALLTWASGAPVRIGYDVPGRRWMYTTTVHRPRELRPRHSVENQWDLLPALDPAFADGPDPARDRIVVAVDGRARHGIAHRITSWRVPADARLIVVHVSAGNPFRRWPESAFAALASALVQAAPNRVVVLTGGPSDRAATTRVIADARLQAPEVGERIVDGESLSLAELRALCDRADLYVGGDSGPLHVASAADVPIVALFGPTLAARSAPWRPRTLPFAAVDAGPLACRPCDQRVCAPGDFRCLGQITPDAVRAACEAMLSKGERPA